VGLPWIGVAARQGPSHIVLWLLAMLFFYIPSGDKVLGGSFAGRFCLYGSLGTQ
jgi:hypothetical protein